MKYKNVNNLLNDYFLRLKDGNFYYNINNIIDMAIHITAIEKPSFLSVKPDYVSGVETYNLVKEFFGRVNPNYVVKFDEALRHGFVDYYDYKDDTSRREYPGRDFCTNATIDKPAEVVIGFGGNIDDGKNLVHEMIHYFNGMDIANYNSFNQTRQLLSEFVSIYFENKYLDFLLEKGYSEAEINYLKKDRFYDAQIGAKRLVVDNALLLAFDKFGFIDDNSYDFLLEYNFDLPVTRSEFYDDVNILENGIVNKSVDFRPEFLYRYIFAVTLNSYLENVKDEDTLRKMVHLCNTLGVKDSFSSLEDVGINMEEIELKDFYPSLQNQFNKIHKKVVNH